MTLNSIHQNPTMTSRYPQGIIPNCPPNPLDTKVSIKWNICASSPQPHGWTCTLRSQTWWTLLPNIHFPSPAGESQFCWKDIYAFSTSCGSMGPAASLLYRDILLRLGNWASVHGFWISSWKWLGSIHPPGGAWQLISSLHLGAWSCPVSIFRFPFFRCPSGSVSYSNVLVFVFNTFFFFFFA